MELRMARTHATGGFSKQRSEQVLPSLIQDSKNASQADIPSSKGAGASRKRMTRVATAKDKFDPVNPFSYWLLGTDACNERFDKEAAHKRSLIHANRTDGFRAPVYERLSKAHGKPNREGYFRGLKSVMSKIAITLDEVQYDDGRAEAIRNNLKAFEATIDKKEQEPDFNEMVFKAKRIPVRKYVEYKREIRLSKLKRVDIEANINDMNNLIEKAEEELAENQGTEKKSIEEVNATVKLSKEELDQERKKKIEATAKYNDLIRSISDVKNHISYVDNEIRELRQKIILMDKNKDFLLKMSSSEGDPAKKKELDDFDGRLLIHSVEQLKNDRFEPAPILGDNDHEEEAMLLLTAPSGLVRKLDYDQLTEMETLNPLISEFGSPLEFLEKLRRIESENLDIMQLSQNLIEEINQLDAQILKIGLENSQKTGELQKDLEKLNKIKTQEEERIKAKLDLINLSANAKLQVEGKDNTAAGGGPTSGIPANPTAGASLGTKTSPSLKGANKDGKLPRKTVGEAVNTIFKSYAHEDLKKEFDGRGVLQQLKCIEMSLMIYLESIREILSEKDPKKLGKKHKLDSKFSKLPDALSKDKLDKLLSQTAFEDEVKAEKERLLAERLTQKSTRRDFSRTFLNKQEVVAKEAEVDEAALENAKYFRSAGGPAETSVSAKPG